MKDREDYLKTGIFYGQKIDLEKNNPILKDREKKQMKGDYV